MFADPSACELADARGWCDYERKLIIIDRTLDERLMNDTLWHEILHALMHEHAFPERQEEEAVVTFLGRALEVFCRDNSRFVRDYLVPR